MKSETKEQLKQYFFALAVASAVFAVFSLYLFLRRGYYDLFIINKALASVAIVLLGVVLLMGPLSRFYNRFDKWLLLRREIGITAFLAAAGHALLSFYFLSERFNPAFFQKNAENMLLGAAGLAILFVLFLTSCSWVIKNLNRTFWVQLQSWGVRIGTLLAFGHLVILKYPGWIKWLKMGGSQELARPDFPPASLIGALFLGFVGIVRLSEIFGIKAARKIFEAGLFVLILIFVVLFLWQKI